jgi:hypothetical protein
MNFCSALVSLIEAAVAGAKYATRLGSLLLAIAAARWTPARISPAERADGEGGLELVGDR